MTISDNYYQLIETNNAPEGRTMDTHPQIELMYSKACRRVERGIAKSAQEFFMVKTGSISNGRIELMVRPTANGLRGTWSLNYARITKSEAVKLMRRHDYFHANPYANQSPL